MFDMVAKIENVGCKILVCSVKMEGVRKIKIQV